MAYPSLPPQPRPRPALSPVAASQKILDDVGINPFFGRENLVWAPSWKHSNAYAIEVNLRLQKAYKDGLKDGVSGEKEAVEKELKDITIEIEVKIEPFASFLLFDR